ncbi:MAG: PfkB family carbohydrate kinase [Candidatus Falkowbacteria bacterium]
MGVGHFIKSLSEANGGQYEEIRTEKKRRTTHKPVIALASSIMTDIIGDAEALKRDFPDFDPGRRYNLSDFPAGFEPSFGGGGPNIAYNLAMLGLSAVILGQTGNDFAPYEKRLKNHRIDVSWVRKHPEEPGSYVVITNNGNGDQSFYTSYCTFDLDYCRVIRKIRPDWLVISPDNGPAPSMEYVKIANEQGIPYIFDPGQNVEYYKIPDIIEAVRGARIVICNEKEYEILKKSTGMWLYGVSTLIITKGERGVEVREKKRFTRVEAVRVDAFVEPTGAGDAFRAGLLYGLIKNWPLEKTLMFGNTVASFAVEFRGTQSHYFKRAMLKERFKDNYGEELKL